MLQRVNGHRRDTIPNEVSNLLYVLGFTNHYVKKPTRILATVLSRLKSGMSWTWLDDGDAEKKYDYSE
jgi:hypothetical protein